MKRLDDSLSAYAKVRVSVSIDARVMAEVRAAARRRAQARIGVRQGALLLAAALGVGLVEAGGWLGAVRGIGPLRLAPYRHALHQLLFVTLQLVKIVEQLVGALASAAAATLTSPAGLVLALGAFLFVLFVLFMAARRVQWPAAARGL